MNLFSKLTLISASVFLASCQTILPSEASTAKAHDSSDAFRPFDETRNAQFDLTAALVKAKVNETRVLAVLGGNWCHDSRGLAEKLASPELSEFVENNFEVVYIDVGHRDRNLDISRQFGVNELFGTPTIILLSPEGVLLNADSAHNWRDAHSKSTEKTRIILQAYAE